MDRKHSVVAAGGAGTGSSPGSAHNSRDHSTSPSLNHSRKDKDKSHHPTTASAAHSAHNSHGHTPQITPRSNLMVVKHDHHHAAGPDKENVARNVIDKLEQRLNQQLAQTGKSDTLSTHLVNTHPFITYALWNSRITQPMNR